MAALQTDAPTTASSAAAPDRLPSPADRPNADILIYDGECKFCTASVHKLHRFDRHGRLAFISLHDPEVRARWPELSHDDLMQYMYVVTPEGRKFHGAEAFKHLSTKLPMLYWMAPILHIPGLMPLWQMFYRAFAKRRYRWGRIESCENGTCKLPARK
jgi:predicted DCC family thiol-disulfide oxidoreductase YuxK